MKDRHTFWLACYPILWPISMLYQCAQAMRRFFYKKGFLSSVQFSCKVISVGNTLVGGTGKTPVVIEIARFLRKQNSRVAILTRGYHSGLSKLEGVVLLGGKPVLYVNLKKQRQWVEYDEKIRKRPNADEAFLQSHHLPDVPVIVGARRADLMQLFLEQNLIPKVGQERTDRLILDDGLQHLGIQRDVDICLGLADLNWLGDKVMPLGRLRESNRVLSAVDYILLTKAQDSTIGSAWLQGCSIKGGVSRIEPATLQKVFAGSLLMEPCAEVPTSACILVSAIAMPDSFEMTVKNIGIKVHAHEKFGDHEVISLETLKSIRDKGLPIITTEKDFFRHPDLFKEVFSSLFVLPIRVTIPKSLEQIVGESLYKERN